MTKMFIKWVQMNDSVHILVTDHMVVLMFLLDAGQHDLEKGCHVRPHPLVFSKTDGLMYQTASILSRCT